MLTLNGGPSPQYWHFRHGKLRTIVTNLSFRVQYPAIWGGKGVKFPHLRSSHDGLVSPVFQSPVHMNKCTGFFQLGFLNFCLKFQAKTSHICFQNSSNFALKQEIFQPTTPLPRSHACPSQKVDPNEIFLNWPRVFNCERPNNSNITYGCPHYSPM